MPDRAKEMTEMPSPQRPRTARLRRSDCSRSGLRRLRQGRGVRYVDEHGKRVSDGDTLKRIGVLAIPSAWNDVWICPFPNGHLQAVGTDAKGRRQYLYHQRWRQRRDQQKFDAMVEFARALPDLRAVASRDLDQEGPTRERVLAAAIRLLDRGFFRVGGEEYAEDNETYGLATMKKRHVSLLGNGLVVFDYPAKAGKQRVQAVVDTRVCEILAALKRRRGRLDELLAYREGRQWQDISSADINAYIKSSSGGDFSAKDFRTWHATVLAAIAIAVSGRAARSATARKRAITRSVAEVAHYLGNTPAVCRASYIDPRVFDQYNDGLTIGGVLAELGDHPLEDPSLQGPVEAAVLDLLEDEDSRALQMVG
jgi:DNA topoisomerase I